MTFFSLQPFVPSGPDLDASRRLFEELGFETSWDAGDYIGFHKDGCRFILQKFNNRAFAENFMITVNVSDADGFHRELTEKNLPEKFGIRLGQPADQPYGREVNLIDLAGVCWHFVQS